MRGLPAPMAPLELVQHGRIAREIFFFLIAFGATFGSALLGLDLLI